MAIAPRHIAVFVCGLSAGIAGAWFTFGSPSTPLAARSSPPVAAPRPGQEPTPPKSPAASVAATAVMGAGPQRASCGSALLVSAGGASDGQVPMPSDVSARTAADAAALILSGKEAAAAGRPRDAEASFLMSCRIAAQSKGPASVEYADAKYQLGRHYANVASSAAMVANRQELVGRAELLYSDSLQTYLGKYGEGHEKSKFAIEGLANLRETVAQFPRPTRAAVAAGAVAVANPPSVPVPVAAAVTTAPTPKPKAKDAEPVAASREAKALPEVADAPAPAEARAVSRVTAASSRSVASAREASVPAAVVSGDAQPVARRPLPPQPERQPQLRVRQEARATADAPPGGEAPVRQARGSAFSAPREQQPNED